MENPQLPESEGRLKTTGERINGRMCMVCASNYTRDIISIILIEMDTDALEPYKTRN